MAVYRQLVSEIFPSAPSFSLNDLPSVSPAESKVAIVTGGNVGIGHATAEVLLQKGWKVYITSRDDTKGANAVKELQQSTGKNAIQVLKLDLADLTTIKGSVEDFKNKERNLHLLINNAGVMAPPKGSKTAQGHELQIGTNGLGHFLFTKLLMTTLLETATSSGDVRVINVSSNGHLGAPKGGLNLDDPNLGFNDPWGSYGQSKFMNIILTKGLVQRYGDKGLISHSLNPGVIGSNLTRHGGSLQNMILKPITQPLSLGRMTSLYAALSTEAGNKEINGSYWIPWGRKGVNRTDADEPENIEKIWNWMEAQISSYA